MLKLLVVGAAGGLGSSIVREALSRGHQVSVLVRSAEKFQSVLGADTSKVVIHVGDASNDEAILNTAVKGINVIISAAPPNPVLAKELGKAALASDTKLVWTAGSSNILEEDGITLHYKAFGPMGEGFYQAHTPCIDAIKSTGAKFVIWCPGFMKGVGQKSTSPVEILTHAAPKGASDMDFVSYEDAADVICRVAENSTWDNKLIAGVSKKTKSEL